MTCLVMHLAVKYSSEQNWKIWNSSFSLASQRHVCFEWKPLIIENNPILTERNTLTRRRTTLEPQQVLFFGDFYTLGRLGAFRRSLSTLLCSVDTRLSSLGHNTTHQKEKKCTKALKLMSIANILTQYNNIYIIIY